MINNIKKVVVLPFGCGNKSERLLLNLSSASHPGMNSVVYKPINNGIEEEEIVIKRIDELFQSETLLKIDVCKVDVSK